MHEIFCNQGRLLGYVIVRIINADMRHKRWSGISSSSVSLRKIGVVINIWGLWPGRTLALPLLKSLHPSERYVALLRPWCATKQTIFCGFCLHHGVISGLSSACTWQARDLDRLWTTVWQYSQPIYPRQLLCRRGLWKNRDFQLISRFISETIQDKAIVTMEY